MTLDEPHLVLAHSSLAHFPLPPRGAMPGVEFPRQLPSNGENDKWDISCETKVSIVSPLQRWDPHMRCRAAVATAVTEDKARTTGPFRSPNKTTPRSYVKGNATLPVSVESAPEPLPRAPCLQVNKAGKARPAFSKCAVKFSAPQFPGGSTGSQD